MIEFVHKKPTELTESDFDDLVALIASGAQNPRDKIKPILKNAHLISMSIDNQEKIGVVVAKKPTKERIRLIEEAGELTKELKSCDIEIGFWLIKPEYRSMKTGWRLWRESFERLQYDGAMFCLIKNDSLKMALERKMQFDAIGKRVYFDFTKSHYYIMFRD